MGGGATRIGGLEEFHDTYLEFGLGMRFYGRFLQIWRPENLPDRPHFFGFWVRGGGTMGGGATRIGGLMDWGLMNWWIDGLMVDGMVD